jgi:hypothetical protein
MSYIEAFQVGWSILWRKLAWTAAVALLLLLIRESTSQQVLWQVGCVVVPILLFYIFPNIIRGLTSIQYPDFRLTLHRPTGGNPRLTYFESLMLLFAIYLVNGFFAAPIGWILRETYQFVVLLFYPLVVAAPLAAYTLVNFPTNRFELEVERRATFPATL